MPIIPPSEEKKTRSIRVSKSLLEKIDNIALEKGESGNYIIEKLLEFALSEYENEQKSKKPAR
jgi:hypothetical protein